MRRFNVTGLCVPKEDYMVDISGKIAQIRKLVDDRCYFTINRARQYGKTTTLLSLTNDLANDYLAVSISFEGIGDESFESAAMFCQTFLNLVRRALDFTDASDEYKESWRDSSVLTFAALSEHITDMCKPSSNVQDKKVVLMIDEVDKMSNNRVYLHFLGMLRDKFLGRKSERDYTFHSVILAGVYDIQNIKLKMVSEGIYEPSQVENALYNSPWNIAVPFNVDMSFSSGEIAAMLSEYELDHCTGMDIQKIANEIYAYTCGYPFLVSRVCQCIDEELDKNWTVIGLRDAVQLMIGEKNTLFDDMIKNLENNKDLFDLIYDVLFVGNERVFNTDNPIIDLGHMHGYLKQGEGSKTVVTNRIFELRLYEYFLSKDSTSRRKMSTGVLQKDVVVDGRFDMELCLRKFADHYAEIWSERDADFIEREGRLLFLSYLKPLINGQGLYHIESQLTDLRRMDIVVDFGQEQFIIELKLWRGEASHEKAYEQLLGYMESKGVNEGYLLTFDFRKDENKLPYANWVEKDGKKIFDVIV
ncbi:MAG: AAA-like domain-containing protein [Oscillospiraceae bacterium]|nr:AAA-like domain-containing protein [Oscillospiraceae bacterium]